MLDIIYVYIYKLFCCRYTNPVDGVSVEYISDTPDTSEVETSNSIYDITIKPSTSSMSKYTAFNTFNSNGGRLWLYNGEIGLYIPELSICKNFRKHISLMLLSDDSTLNFSADSSLICSTIIQSSPRSYNFLKPVVLKIPHCLVNHELWDVNIFQADNDYDDLNVTWRKIIVLGQESINTPVFVHLEPAHLYIMTEVLGRFVMVADPKSITTFTQPSIRMKLIVFSQITPSSNTCSLRIYIVKDLPNSRDICSSVEVQLGGSYMGESHTFAFHLNNCNLTIRVHTSCKELGVELNEQVIPYKHILSNSSLLHCEFSIRSSKYLYAALTFNVDFEQFNGIDSGRDLQSFSISSLDNTPSIGTSDLQTIVFVDRQGNFVNTTNGLNSIQILPRVAKCMICAALDPPRIDERDWRLLAKKLKVDRYIAYFATKSSPTEQILNLWECRASSSPHTMIELLMTLKDMERKDILNIIADIFGPLWI